MKRDEIKSGAALSYVSIFLNTIIGLLYMPYMLRQLGQSEFGLYMLIGSLVGYISLLDFGLNNTVDRFVAKYQSAGDLKSQENFLASTFIFYGFIILLIVLAGTAIHFNLNRLFTASLTADELTKAKIMFAILVFNLAITLPLGAFNSIIRGYGSFVFSNSISIARILLRTIVLITILALGFKSVAIVVVDSVFNIGAGLIYLVYCFSKLHIKIKLHHFNKELAREIFGYSFFIFMLAMVNQFFWKLGQVALGIISNTAMVAIFALSISLVTYYQHFSLGISSVFLPKVSQLVSKGATRTELTTLMIKVGRVQLSILGLVLVGFIALGKPFILLWAGPEYTNVYWITLIIFLPETIPMIQTIAEVIIQVENKLKFQATASLIMSGFNILLAVVLGVKYEAFGVGISTAVSIAIFRIVIMNIYYHNKLGLDISRFFREVFRGILPVMVLTAMAGLATRYLPGRGWILLLLQTIITGTIYFALMYRFGLRPEERQSYIQPVIDRFRKSKPKNSPGR